MTIPTSFGSKGNLPRLKSLEKEFRSKEEGIMASKRQDYSGDTDVLRNFKEVAAFTGLKPAEVATIYLMKHIQAVKNAVQGEKYTWVWEINGREGLKQRVADARNYLLLLAVCIDEEVGGEGDGECIL